MQIKLTKTFDFEAAHWLPTFPEQHKCRRLHGHSFHIVVIVRGEVPADKGYLIDFGDLKAACRPCIDQLDHRLLNDIEGLSNPTAEMLAKWLYDRIKLRMPILHSITVRETCTSEATYEGT